MACAVTTRPPERPKLNLVRGGKNTYGGVQWDGRFAARLSSARQSTKQHLGHTNLGPWSIFYISYFSHVLHIKS